MRKFRIFTFIDPSSWWEGPAMNFKIYFGRLHPPVIIVTDTGWVQGRPYKVYGKKIKIFKTFFIFFLNTSMCRNYSVTWVLFRKYFALIYPLSKTLKIFELKKVDFFIEFGKNNFLLKKRVQIKNGVHISIKFQI